MTLLPQVSRRSERWRRGPEVSIRMAMKDINPTEEVLGEFPGYEAGVGRMECWIERYRELFQASREEGKAEGGGTHPSVRLNDKTLGLRVDGTFQNLCAAVPSEMCVRVFPVCEYIVHDLVVERSVWEICPSKDMRRETLLPGLPNPTWNNRWAPIHLRSCYTRAWYILPNWCRSC
jgi:hypothetical protein